MILREYKERKYRAWIYVYKIYFSNRRLDRSDQSLSIKANANYVTRIVQIYARLISFVERIITTFHLCSVDLESLVYNESRTIRGYSQDVRTNASVLRLTIEPGLRIYRP